MAPIIGLEITRILVIISCFVPFQSGFIVYRGVGLIRTTFWRFPSSALAQHPCKLWNHFERDKTGNYDENPRDFEPDYWRHKLPNKQMLICSALRYSNSSHSPYLLRMYMDKICIRHWVGHFQLYLLNGQRGNISTFWWFEKQNYPTLAVVINNIADF